MVGLKAVAHSFTHGRSKDYSLVKSHKVRGDLGEVGTGTAVCQVARRPGYDLPGWSPKDQDPRSKNQEWVDPGFDAQSVSGGSHPYRLMPFGFRLGSQCGVCLTATVGKWLQPSADRVRHWHQFQEALWLPRHGAGPEARRMAVWAFQTLAHDNFIILTRAMIGMHQKVIDLTGDLINQSCQRGQPQNEEGPCGKTS